MDANGIDDILCQKFRKSLTCHVKKIGLSVFWKGRFSTQSDIGLVQKQDRGTVGYGIQYFAGIFWREVSVVSYKGYEIQNRVSLNDIVFGGGCGIIYMSNKAGVRLWIIIRTRNKEVR